jgi:hypothetical protein
MIITKRLTCQHCLSRTIMSGSSVARPIMDREEDANFGRTMSKVAFTVERLTEGIDWSRHSSAAASARCPFGVLASLLFPDRRPSFWYSTLWEHFRLHCEYAVEQHPYQYVNTHTLWCEGQSMGMEEDSESVQPDQLLTADGVFLAIEAWIRLSVVAPSSAGCSFTTDELCELDFWQCFGKTIVNEALCSPDNGETQQINAELEQGLSNLHLRETAQQYAALTGQRLKHNRERHATHFSRLQAFGIHTAPNADGTTQAHAFFLPASQILQNMQRFFRSSTAFEESRWKTVHSYNHFTQFTNIMLLNLCRHVIRQISVMFRIQAQSAAAGGSSGDLFMLIDQLLEPDLLASCDLPTQTELILSHAEPRHWMPAVSINLQRFLSSGLHATATPALPTQPPFGTGGGVAMPSFSGPLSASATMPARQPVSDNPTTNHSVSALPSTRKPKVVALKRARVSSILPKPATETPSAHADTADPPSVQPPPLVLQPVTVATASAQSRATLPKAANVPKAPASSSAVPKATAIAAPKAAAPVAKAAATAVPKTVAAVAAPLAKAAATAAIPHDVTRDEHAGNISMVSLATEYDD